MREIKFRGNREDNNKWVYGDYFYDGFHCVHCIREGAHIPPTYDEPGGDYHQEDHEINADTLGQYTGLKDKNGKEIYEGDVLVIKIALFYGDEDKFKGVVGFQDGTFCLERIDQPERAKKQGYVERVRLWNDGEHDHYSLEIIETFEMEVIGNVHENKIES